MSPFFYILACVNESEKKIEASAEQPPKVAPFTNGDLPNWSAWRLAGELGYTIAIPIVLLALLGRWADRQFESSPWLLLAGIVVSIFISSALVYRKVSKIIK